VDAHAPVDGDGQGDGVLLDATPEPDVTFEPDATHEPDATQALDATSDTATAAETSPPDTTVAIDGQLDTVLVPDTDPGPDTEPGPDAKPDTEPSPDAKPDTSPDTEPGPDTAAEPDATVDTTSSADSATSDAEPDMVGSDATTDASTDAGPDAEVDACVGDGCGCTPSVERCNGRDDDCNGLTDDVDDDEDGASACGDIDCDDTDSAIHPGALETSDDGVDSDCDQRELFAGQSLALASRLGRDTMRVAVRGTYTVDGIGPIDVTGELTRDAAAGPVSWCISGVTSFQIGPLTLRGATVEVCHALGETTTTLAGRVKIGSVQLDASGPFGADLTLALTLPAGDTWEPAPGLTFATATGELRRHAGAVTAEFTAQDPGPRPLYGLDLTALSATSTYANGAVSVTIAGNATLSLGTASAVVALAGVVADPADLRLSGRIATPINVAPGLVLPWLDVTHGLDGTTLETFATAPLPVGWPSTSASLAGAYTPPATALTGSIPAPYRLGQDGFELSDAHLELSLSSAPTLTLSGDAALPWDPTGLPLRFVAAIEPGERPVLQALAASRTLCGIAFADVAITATVDANGALAFGEALGASTSVTIEGTPHLAQLTGGADGADFTLTAELGDLTVMEGAFDLRRATVEVACEGGLPTHRLRGIHDIVLPDGATVALSFVGALGPDGALPLMRGELPPDTKLKVFANAVGLTSVAFEAARRPGVAGGADLFIEGEERVTLASLGTDLALRYRGPFTPGSDLTVLDGVPQSGDALDLASLHLTSASGRLSRPASDLVREITGRYDYELPDGDIISAILSGRIAGTTNTFLRGEILGEEAGLYTFFDQVTLARAGLEVTLSATAKSVAIFGDFEFDLGDTPLALAMRGQFTSYSSQAGNAGKQLTLSGHLTGPGGAPLVDLVPDVLELTDVTVSLIAQKLKNVSDGDKLVLRIDGGAALTLGDSPEDAYEVRVAGEVGLAKSTLVTPGTTAEGKSKARGLSAQLEGQIVGDVQPLRAVLGDDRAALIDPRVVFDLKLKPTPTVRVILSSDAEICVTESCTLGAGIQLAAAGVFQYAKNGGASGWVRGVVRDVELPGIGNIGTAGFVINSAPLIDFDVLGDNRDLVSDSRYWLPDDLVGDARYNRLPVVDPGITLVYQRELPLHFPDVDPGEVQFAFGIGPFSATASARVPIGLPLVVPEFQFPGVDRLTLLDARLTLSIGFEGQSVSLALDGRAELLPHGQQLPLVGSLAVRGALDTLGASLDATASVEGRWTEPFGLSGFALQNPAVSLGLNVTPTGVVTPSSVGVNTDLFFLTEGAWPAESADLAAQQPPNVVKLGGTVYFDKRRTKSALCLPLDLYCASLPTVILRFELQNLNILQMLQYLQRMSNFIVSTSLDVAEAFSGNVLARDIELPLSPDDGQTRLNHLALVFSTHDTKVMGQRFDAGLRASLDMQAVGRSVLFDGYVWSNAIKLDGFADGISLGYVDLVGDPYRQSLAPAAGHLAAPADARLDLASGTLEGWVRGRSGTLIDHLDASGGYRLSILHDDTSRLVFAARRDGLTRTTTTLDPLVLDDRLHHVAVVFAGPDAEFFVDGFHVDAAATGAPLDAGPAASSAPLLIGEGFAEVDDVRVWNTVRARADLKAQAHALPLGFQQDPALVARYELDYDTAYTAAHNSRLYPGDKLHAAFVGGAKPRREIDDNDLHLLFHLSLTDIGIGFEAGGALSFPPLAPILPDGIDQRARFFLDVSPFGLRARGNFHMSPTPFLPAFYFNTEGNLRVDGYYLYDGGGPNLTRGDFDDGPYGAFDLAAVEFASSVALVHVRGDGTRRDIGSATMSYACPPGATCSGFSGKEFHAQGDLDLIVPFGGGPIDDLPPEKVVRVEGNFLAAPGELSVGGSAADPGRITAFGHVLADGCFFMTSDTRTTVCDDCGNGVLEGAETCDDGNRTDNDGCNANCKREPLDATPGVKRVGWRGLFDIPSFVHAEMTANIAIDGPAAMHGHGTLTAGGVLLSDTEFRLDPTGFYAKSHLQIGETAITVEGEVGSDGSFDLASHGNLTIAGLTLSDVTVHAYSNGQVGGVTVDGRLDLAFMQVEVHGALDANGHVSLTYDGTLDIAGWAMSNVHLVVDDAGADLQGDLHFGAATAWVTGSVRHDSFAFAGAYDLPLAGFTSAATLTLQGGAGSVSGALDASLTIGESSARVTGAITPDGGFRLAGSGTLRVGARTWSDLVVSLNASAPDAGFRARGRLDLGFMQVDGAGTVAPDGTYRFESQGALALGDGFSTQAAFVISNAGVTASTSLVLGGANIALAGAIDNGAFTLVGHGDLTIGGNSLLAAEVSASASAVTMTARCALPTFGDVALSGAFHADGSFALDGAIAVAGFTQGTLHLDQNGMRIAGQLDVLGTTVAVSGAVTANTFVLQGSAQLTLGGFSALVAVLFDSTGVSLSTSLGLLGSSVALSGQVSGQSFSLSGTFAPVIAGYTLGGATATLSPGGMSVAGDLQVFGSGIAMSGSVAPNGAFSLSAGSTLALFGRTLTSATATLTNAGLSLAGHLDFTVAGIHLIADVSLANGALRGSGSVSAFVTTVAVSELVLDAQQVTFKGSLELDVALLRVLTNIDFVVSFANPSLCGKGRAVIDTDLGDYPCDLDVCVGALGPQTSNVECHGRCWSDAPCGDGKFCDGLGNCFAKRPLGDTCAGLLAGDHECESGFCDIWAVAGRAVCAPRLAESVGCLQDGQCQSNNCGARPGLLEFRCFNPGTRGVGEECYDPDHCYAGGCWGTPTWPSRCLCETNDDCARSGHTGQVCNLGTWGITPGSGECMAPLQAGQSCDATSECQGGLTCDGGVCIAVGSRHNWEQCQTSAECVRGSCYLGTCRCANQDDCTVDRGAGWYCDEGIWLLGNNEGQCHPKLADAGAPYCESGDWCQSGRCNWSPRQGRNICWSPVPQPYGATCDLNGHCASNSCNVNRGNTCDPEAYTIPNNVRAYCEDDAWCQGGGVCRYSLAVSKNVCVAPAQRSWSQACDVDMQCGADPRLGCKYWPIGGGSDVPGLPLGYYCGY
ncbi:MAG: hypothetical protein JNJ59_24310, partial [Deltaproteobacteria bacterium]|nr:hypothetical protein [Deltaproteobacteria bacterium]